MSGRRKGQQAVIERVPVFNFPGDIGQFAVVGGFDGADDYIAPEEEFGFNFLSGCLRGSG
jgi:hypothetical protein